MLENLLLLAGYIVGLIAFMGVISLVLSVGAKCNKSLKRLGF